MEAEKALAKQKEALKGKVAAVTSKPKSGSTNNTGTKSSAPSVKKQLTVETEPNLPPGQAQEGDAAEGSSESSDKKSEEEQPGNSSASSEGSAVKSIEGSEEPEQKDEGPVKSSSSSASSETTAADSGKKPSPAKQ
jgi:hypothetical protein